MSTDPLVASASLPPAVYDRLFTWIEERVERMERRQDAALADLRLGISKLDERLDRLVEREAERRRAEAGKPPEEQIIKMIEALTKKVNGAPPTTWKGLFALGGFRLWAGGILGILLIGLGLVEALGWIGRLIGAHLGATTP